MFESFRELVDLRRRHEPQYFIGSETVTMALCPLPKC